MAELTVKSKFFAMKDKVELSDEELAEKVAVKMEVSDITSLTNEQLDKLKAGDIVTKKTGNQLHTYIVSYKGEGAGECICLTYTASGYIETVSYDRTNSGWVYNSTDICNIDDIPNVEEAPSGTIQDALGLNSSGKLVKGSVSAGTKLYHHVISYSLTSSFSPDRSVAIVTTFSTVLTSSNIASTITTSNIVSIKSVSSTIIPILFSKAGPNIFFNYLLYSNDTFTQTSDALQTALFLSDTVTEL